MPRKKKSEMTPVELVDQALEGRSWEEAETAGIEVIARCVALHAYARKDGTEYFQHIMKKIAKRADEWAHEPGNPFILAMASVGNSMEQEKSSNTLNSNSNEK